MAKGGFGSELWKNVSAVRLGKDGGIKAPVRANSKQGIVVGLNAVARSDAALRKAEQPQVRPPRRGWRRLLHR